MAINRKRKEELLQIYSDRLGRAQVAIWTTFRALTVAQISALRGQLRGVGAEALVVKNTLIRRALEDAGLPMDDEIMTGPCLVTFGFDDLAATAKIVADFAKANDDNLEIKGGILNGALIGAANVQALSDLPSRETLLATVAAVMQAPVVGLVSAMSAVLRGFPNAINALKEQREEAA